MRKRLQKTLILANRFAPHGLFLWVVLLSLLYSLLSVIRHTHFQSGAFDLGIFDQALWQYSRFHFPYNTIKERFILGDHLTLTLPLLSPLYYIWNDVRSLLIFQAVWMTVSSIAVYKIALLRKFSAVASVCLAIIYSLFFGIQYGVFFDFHTIIIGVGILMWTAYFLEAGKTKLLWISIVLGILTQENMGFALACLGLVYIFEKKHRKYAIGFILGGLAASVVATKIIALFSPVGYEYWRSLPSDPFNLIYGFFDTSERQQVWLYSLSWFAFLPLLSPGALLAIVLDLSQYYVLGRNFSWMQGPFLHHRAILGVFLILGTIQSLAWLRQKRLPVDALVGGLLLLCLSLQFYFHFPLNKLSKTEYTKREAWMDNNDALFKLVPQNSSVAATQNLVPHLAHRDQIYLLWPRKKHDEKLCGKTDCWWLDFSGKPEYMVVDLHPNQWVTQLLESNENFSSAIANMERNKKITIVKKIGEARMYRIKY